jgi:hypothetical protein
MHALTIRFHVPDDATFDWEAIRERFQARAAVYADMPALKAKAFLVNREAGHVGANYVWESAEDADAFLTSEFWDKTLAAMGLGQPTVQRDEIVAYVENDSVILPAVL